MKKILINYSNEKYRKNQVACSKSANLFFDDVISYNEKDIDKKFYNDNYVILNNPKGAGLWLWKPYFILKSLNNLQDGDILFYCDSGCVFLNKPDDIYKYFEVYKQDILGFGLPLLEYQWTKCELLNEFRDYDIKNLRNSCQLSASFFIIKKSKFAVDFFKDFLDIATKNELINDSFDNNIQHNEFIEHRHDQSIFSLLYKINSLKVLKDPSQFGKYPMLYSGTSQLRINSTFKEVLLTNKRRLKFVDYKENYSDIIFHCRGSNPYIYRIKFMLKEILSTIWKR